MTLAHQVLRDPGGGFASLFEGRRVFWSFNTRVAIRAACDLLGLQAGDEILVPAYNCGSEVDPLVHAGLSVVLYPVARDLRADPQQIEALITERTRAIYVTHFFGMIQPELQALRALCDQRGLRMIEDCALSLLSGSSPADGRTGDISVFCFHKFLPVLEGGALVINAPAIIAEDPFQKSPPAKTVIKKLVRAGLANMLGAARAARLSQNLHSSQGHGSAQRPGQDSLEDIPGHYYFSSRLMGARMSSFTARSIRAFSVSETISKRRRNWAVYEELLEDVSAVSPLISELPSDACPMVFPVIAQNRHRIVSDLQALGIGATPWWAGYNRNLDWQGQTWAMDLKENVLSLPLHQFLAQPHLEYIVAHLRRIVPSA